MQDGDPTQDKDTGTLSGVPSGAATDQSKGLPDSGRHESEAAVHPDAGKDQATDI